MEIMDIPKDIPREVEVEIEDDESEDTRDTSVKTPDSCCSLERSTPTITRKAPDDIPIRKSFMISDILKAQFPKSDEESDSGLSDEKVSPSGIGRHIDSRTKRPRKARTAFTDHQLNELERSFERQKYLSVQDRMELANRLNLSDTQVKTWYQNRRTKWKRQTAVGLELLAEAGNFAAVQRMLQTNPYWAYHPAAQSIVANMEAIAIHHTGVLQRAAASPQTAPALLPRIPAIHGFPPFPFPPGAVSSCPPTSGAMLEPSRTDLKPNAV